MQRSAIYLVVGTIIGFLLNHFFLGSKGWQVDLYYGFSFGLAWGLAYFLDHPGWSLFKKLGISFIGIFLLIVLGLIFFKFELAIPAIVKFSTVFVGYYLFASFRNSKSLRE